MKPSNLLPGLFAATLLAFPALGASDILIADFEGPDYGDWKVTGEVFGPGPAHGTLPGQMAVDGFLGKGLVNSFYKGDDTIGTLESPPLKLERPYLAFLIGGGMHPGKACINLVIEGQTVRSATGPNDKPGGTERLDWQWWDVRDFAGKTATIQIIDQAKGSWGHINIDHIVQTERRPPGWRSDARLPIRIDKPWLHLPVKNGAPQRLVSLVVDGMTVRQFDIELANSAPDWWAYLDLRPFQGENALLCVDRLREDSGALEAIRQADTQPDPQQLYREKLRPQFHFTSRRGWNNDPNGLVYFQGEYHLFYQHNPYGWNWGNMHWGHAVSPDLVHWEELGDAIYPDDLGTAFSGSAIVDEKNTAGFAPPGGQSLVCMYTAAAETSRLSQGRKFTQALAYSLDRGRTWAKYEKNPVLNHIVSGNRDPKVIWYAPENKWVMALFLDNNDFALFDSRDLKSWNRLSDVKVAGAGECPEFFEIPVHGQPGETRWVFYGGNGRYLIGRFDGKTFRPGAGPYELNFGNCFYASQTYNDIPASDGRQILVAWGQINFPGMPFNQMMDFPVELTLRNTEEGFRLYAYPVREIESLRVQTRTFAAQALKSGDNPLAGIEGELLDVAVEFAPGDATEVGLTLRGLPITYDTSKQVLSCLDRKAKLKPENGRIRLRALVDRASVEIFGNDGRLYMPMGSILQENQRSLELSVKGGEAQLQSGTVHTLKSAWPGL